MKKFMFMLVAVAFIAFGYTAGAFAADKDKSMGRDASDVGTWFGADVKNPQGEDLGKIDDFVRDDNGDVSLVIISHGGIMGMGEKRVAVPFSAISFDQKKEVAMLDVTKEQLANAPSVNETDNLNNPQFAQEVNRYFGQRSQWSDQGTGDEGTRARGYYGSDDRFDTNRGAVEDMQSDTLPYGDY